MLSIQLDITSRKIVIVGGGRVALRKAHAVVTAGATEVTAIATTFRDGFPPSVRLISTTYASQHLAGASLVFAATDRPEVNDAVVRDAHAIGALVNRADVTGDEAGDFTLPATAVVGDIRLTVAAGSPALSAAIRERIVRDLDPRFAVLATAMKTLRPWVVAQKHLSPDERAAIFRDLASEAALSNSDVAALREWIIARHPTLHSGPSPSGEG